MSGWPNPQRKTQIEPQWGALAGFLACLAGGVLSLFGLYHFFQFTERFFRGLVR